MRVEEQPEKQVDTHAIQHTNSSTLLLSRVDSETQLKMVPTLTNTPPKVLPIFNGVQNKCVNASPGMTATVECSSDWFSPKGTPISAKPLPCGIKEINDFDTRNKLAMRIAVIEESDQENNSIKIIEKDQVVIILVGLLNNEY